MLLEQLRGAPIAVDTLEHTVHFSKIGQESVVRKEWTKLIQEHTNAHTETHTSWKEGTDHEAEVDGGHGEGEQEDKDQGGVAVAQHCSVRAHLQQFKNK